MLDSEKMASYLLIELQRNGQRYVKCNAACGKATRVIEVASHFFSLLGLF